MHFLQSVEWEKLQKDLGRTTWRVQDILVIRYDLPFGKNYLYTAGAAFEPKAFEEIKKIAEQEKVMFLKWEAMSSDEGEKRALQGAGFRRSFKALQPQKTIVLDLTQSEEDLFAQLHSKTRYNMGVAKRHGVTVKTTPAGSLPAEELNSFIGLLQDTARRDGFHGHPIAYYKKLAALPLCELFVAEQAGRIPLEVSPTLARPEGPSGGLPLTGQVATAALILFFEGTATYLHGASDYALRHLMAPHLLHGEIMREAKKRGCTHYDLWGIDEQRWPGVTRFKRGLGGKEISYIGSWDFVFQSFFYAAYRAWNARRII